MPLTREGVKTQVEHAHAVMTLTTLHVVLVVSRSQPVVLVVSRSQPAKWWREMHLTNSGTKLAPAASKKYTAHLRPGGSPFQRPHDS